MSEHKLVEFRNIDRSTDPDYFIRFLDNASSVESFQAYKRRATEWLAARPGDEVLEVACGTGDDAQALARLGCRVIGVDYSRAMVAEARRRAEGKGLPLEFHWADAQQLDLQDSRFDACRCDRSFMHMAEPKRALAEMVRVTKSGGRVVVFEVDFETLTIDAPDRVLARKVIHAWTDGFRNGWLGRYVPAFFRELGLLDVKVEPHVLRQNEMLANELVGQATTARARETGVITADEAAAWLGYVETALRTGRYFSTLTGFLVCGRKP